MTKLDACHSVMSFITDALKTTRKSKRKSIEIELTKILDNIPSFLQRQSFSTPLSYDIGYSYIWKTLRVIVHYCCQSRSFYSVVHVVSTSKNEVHESRSVFLITALACK